MSGQLIPAASLRRFVQQVFVGIGYPHDQATDAADVLLWASLRGVDTHGVRNLKPYYVDRTLSGQLRHNAQIRIEHQTPQTARLDGDCELGLACACHAMRLAIEKCRITGVGIVCVRNTHHLGPAGYFAHMAVEHGMLGLCMTGHFFGKGHHIGVAPLGSLVPMFSTNPLSFAAPCGRHPPFVLDMSTSVATVNRIEMHAQEGRPIPTGWACDAADNPTTDPNAARNLLPLGGTADLGGYKGVGLGLMVSILSGILSGAWAPVERALSNAVRRGSPDPAVTRDRRSPAESGDLRSSECAGSGDPRTTETSYDQPTMGHFFAAVRIDAFQPLADFRAAMDAMIDALHAAPTTDPNSRVTYPGEVEFATAAERAKCGIPISDYLLTELRSLSKQLELEFPES